MASWQEELRKAIQEEISRAFRDVGSPQMSCTPSTSNSSSTAANSSRPATLTFEEFYQKRERERQSDFNPKSKKKARREEKTKEVEVKVSLASCSNEGVIKSRRGKTQAVRVNTTATKDDLLKKALEKHTTFDQTFDASVPYTLLYPDFSEVRNIPGTTEAFKLSSYKEAISKEYKRITFYIIPCHELSGKIKWSNFRILNISRFYCSIVMVISDGVF